MESLRATHCELGVSLIESILALCKGKWESFHKGRYWYTIIDAQCDKDILKRISALNNDAWKLADVEYINTSLIFKIKEKADRSPYVLSENGDTFQYRDIYESNEPILFKTVYEQSTFNYMPVLPRKIRTTYKE